MAGIDELSLINELIYKVPYILGDAVGIDELSGSCVHSLLFSWAMLVAGCRVAGIDELSGSCAFASG